MTEAHDPELIRIISDCMCRSDGLEPKDGMLVFGDGGERLPAREWYDACAAILLDTLKRRGYSVERAAA